MASDKWLDNPVAYEILLTTTHLIKTVSIFLRGRRHDVIVICMIRKYFETTSVTSQKWIEVDKEIKQSCVFEKQKTIVSLRKLVKDKVNLLVELH